MAEESTLKMANHPANAEIKWTPEARKRLERVPPFIRDMVKYRMEVFARKRGLAEVSEAVMDEKLERWGEEGGKGFAPTLQWSAEAEERIDRIPSFIRATVATEIEAFARSQGLTSVDVSTVEAAKTSWGSFDSFHLSMVDEPKYKEARRKEIT